MSSTNLFKFVFFGLILGWSEKQDGRPSLWLAETFSTSSLKPLNRIRQNLTGSKISTSFTKSVFFCLIGKKRWPPWPMIGWDIFDFSSRSMWDEVLLFLFHSEVNFFMRSFFSGERQWPFGPLVLMSSKERKRGNLRWSSCKCLGILLRYSSNEQWTTSKEMATPEAFFAVSFELL